MGDPRKIRSKFSGPMHPWQLGRLEAEKPLMKVYGLSNKTELWKVTSKLKKYKDNAKKLVVRTGNQAEIEKKQLAEKLKSFNLIEKDSLDEILDLKVEQLLDRRLQTLVFKKGHARSIKQARQMITHGHINVAEKKMTSPGYLVKLSEENSITYNPSSNFKDPDHPERKTPEVENIKKEKEHITGKKEEVVEKPKKETHKKIEEKKETPKKVEEKKEEPKEEKASEKTEVKAEEKNEGDTKKN